MVHMHGDEGHRAGSGLRRLRQQRGLTQAGLAARAGISLGTVRDLEQGRRARPRAGSLARLAGALGVDAAVVERLADGNQQPDQGPAAAAGHAVGPGLWVQVLGPVMAWRDGRLLDTGSVRQRAVLALLALGRDLPVRREALVDALWPDGPPRSAVNIVQGHVSALRRALGPPGGQAAAPERAVLAWSGAGYRLRAGAAELDLLAFEELARQAEAAAQAGDEAAACGFFERALTLWRGDPAADAGVVAASPVVTALSARRAEVAVGFARAACGAGQPGRALAELRGLAGREPLDERAHAWLMVALAGAGQQAAALEVFTGCRARLDEQLGVRPGPELTRAHDLVLRQQTPGRTGRENVTVTGPPASPRPNSQVPRQLPPVPRGFAGRAAELAAMSGLLGEGGTVAVSSIGGIAGVGKTTLALRWAHQVAAQFPDGQLYVNLRGFGPGGQPVTPEAAIRGFLDALNVPPARVPSDPEAQAGLYRSVIADKRMLLMLDNARDSAQVLPLLPGGPGCLVLVTSRSPLTGLVAAAGARMVPVDVLSPAEARELLSLRLGARRVAAEPVAVSEIVSLTGRLPLALSIVAARAATHPAHPLAGLAAQLRDERGRLDALDGEELPADVRAAFAWSYQQLSEPAARMFRLLGLHPGPDASVLTAASLAAVSPQRARHALAELIEAGLISEPAAGRYSCHDLLRAYAGELTESQDSQDARNAALRRMLAHYLHTAAAARAYIATYGRERELAPLEPGAIPAQIDDRDQAVAWFSVECPALLSVIPLAAESGCTVYAVQLPGVISAYLHLVSRPAQLVECMRVALDAAGRDADVNARGRAHADLGDALTALTEYDEAISQLEEASRLFVRTGDWWGRAEAGQLIATALSRQGFFAEALDHARPALEAFRQVGDRTEEALTLNLMGWLLTGLGHHDEAIKYCEQAIELSERIDSGFLVANARDTLGVAYCNGGRYAEAVDCLRQAISDCQRLGYPWGEAEALSHLGDAYQARGESGSVAETWRQALAILEDLAVPQADEVRAKLKQQGSDSSRRSPARPAAGC
jgi:DNA-binding SARP family transcriptional activator/tetratricopeptide (TPR) repeat protein